MPVLCYFFSFFFFQAEDGIRDSSVTGVQTCALPISKSIGIPNAAGKGAGSNGEVRESGPGAGILPQPGGAHESRKGDPSSNPGKVAGASVENARCRTRPGTPGRRRGGD